MNRLSLMITALMITCVNALLAQVNHYVIDPTFNSADYYTKGTTRGFLIREEFQDIYVNFQRSSGISEAYDQSMLNLDGELVYNVFDALGGIPVLYREGILSVGFGGVAYRVLPPNPDAGGVLDDDIFFFEYSKNVYSFQSFGPTSTNYLILPDKTVLLTGSFSTDSISPGPQGIRHLVRIDSIGDPVDGFPNIICEPLNSLANGITPAEDGSFWLYGKFSAVNGHQTSYLAHLNNDFTVDTTYTSPFIEDFGWASVINIDSDGNLWIGCGLGCNTSSASLEDRTLMKLTPNGLIDPDFNIPTATAYLTSGVDDEMRVVPDIAFEDSDGMFIMGGHVMEYNGSPVKRIFKITPSGDLIPEAFEHLGADEAVWDNWTHEWDLGQVRVDQIARTPEGKLLIGGSFSSFGGESYSCLVRLEQDGFVSTDNQEGDDLRVHVWPNPASTHVKWNKGVESITLVNAVGLTVLEKASDSTFRQIQLPNLPEGLYTLVFQKDNQLARKKIIIQQR
ncbi:MAG: T9SS type A sorting domain-containing protein [Flavobacteriales bacterium]|nr:T9SS type A sorting domain-containing protein [Flavobacteriales bacterium]